MGRGIRCLGGGGERMSVSDTMIDTRLVFPIAQNMTGPASALTLLADLAAKLDEAVKNSPLADVEKNVRAQFIAELANRGLVSREEFDAQMELLEKLRAKQAELETKIARLEQVRAAEPR